MKAREYVGTIILLTIIAIICWGYFSLKTTPSGTPVSESKITAPTPETVTLETTLTLSPFTLSFIKNGDSFVLEPCTSSVTLSLTGTACDTSVSVEKACALHPAKGTAQAYCNGDTLYILWQDIKEGRYRTDKIELPLLNKENRKTIDNDAFVGHLSEELATQMHRYLQQRVAAKELIIRASYEEKRITKVPSSVFTQSPKGIRITFLDKTTLSLTLAAEVL